MHTLDIAKNNESFIIPPNGTKNEKMKKHFLLTNCLFFIVLAVSAQWTTSGSHIYNSNSGNVGIGTSAPGSKLEISGGYITISDHATNRLYATADNVGGYIQTNEVPMRFYVGNTEAMRFVYGGNVGIGTATPVSKLEIANSYLTVSNHATNRLYATTDDLGAYIQTNEIPLRFLIGATERMRVINNGNVGIGTTSPNAILEVYKSAPNTSFEALRLNNDDPNSRSSTSVYMNLMSGGYERGRILAGNPSDYSGQDGYLSFSTRYSNSIYERVRIDKEGNVGIGITSPTEKLSVNGNVRAKKIIVTQIAWSDYVFDANYKLRPLTEVASFIKNNKHLPDVPSAKDVEKKGISVGDNQALLLKKIEELTLYMIDLNKKNEQLQKSNSDLNNRLKRLEARKGK